MKAESQMVGSESSRGTFPDWVDPVVGHLVPEALAKLAAEQLSELRRAYPLQEWPAFLVNGPVLWERLTGSPQERTGAYMAAVGELGQVEEVNERIE